MTIIRDRSKSILGNSWTGEPFTRQTVNEIRWFYLVTDGTIVRVTTKVITLIVASTCMTLVDILVYFTNLIYLMTRLFMSMECHTYSTAWTLPYYIGHIYNTMARLWYLTTTWWFQVNPVLGTYVCDQPDVNRISALVVFVAKGLTAVPYTFTATTVNHGKLCCTYLSRWCT